VADYYTNLIRGRGDTAKPAEQKPGNDYYYAHGYFLLKEKAGRSWVRRHTSNISLGWNYNI